MPNDSPQPRLHFPNGLTTTQARRLADIADAADADLHDPTTFSVPAICDYCGWQTEAGHCYTCKPVWGYGSNRIPKPGSRARARYEE